LAAQALRRAAPGAASEQYSGQIYVPLWFDLHAEGLLSMKRCHQPQQVARQETILQFRPADQDAA
jgi:hypothetical protein